MAKEKPYAKLRAKLVERGMTQEDLARVLGISRTAVGNKMNGRTEFSVKDMKILKLILNLETIDAYVFAD